MTSLVYCSVEGHTQVISTGLSELAREEGGLSVTDNSIAEGVIGNEMCVLNLMYNLSGK